VQDVDETPTIQKLRLQSGLRIDSRLFHQAAKVVLRYNNTQLSLDERSKTGR
jgi:hypothetical protein